MWDGAAGGRFFFGWFQVFHSCLGGEFIKKIEKSSAIKPHTSSGNSFKERNDFWNKKTRWLIYLFFFRALEMVFWCPIHRQKGKNVSGEKKKGKNRIGTFLSTAGVPMTSAEVQTRPLTPFSSAAGGWWQVFRGVAVKVGGQVIMRTTLVVNSSSFLFGRKKKVLVKRTSYFSRFCIDAFRAIFFPKKIF